MNYGEGYSLSDIAAATGNNGNNGGFGDGNGSWWVIIFLIFAFMGWGRNGFGGYGNEERGNSGGGAIDSYVLASDFATLQRQIDSGIASLERKGDAINNGLCDGFYAMNTGMLNGFSGVQQTLCQGFGGLNTAINAQGYETRLGTQNLAAQLANCCCDIRQEIADCCCTTQRAIDGVNYNMAINTNSLNNTMNAGFNGIQNAMCLNTRDLIENQNANYRALHDEIVANRIEDKNAQIQAQQNEINALRLSASQSAQNEYLLNSLRNGCPVNAQLVCGNQPIPVQYVGANCGCNNAYGYSGCGCGSNI